MITKILSIAGKPGLYKIISTGKNLNVVESLTDNKRFPVQAHAKTISMSDVAVFTTDDDVPLRDVFKKIKEKENGQQTSLPAKATNKDLFTYFESVLPNYDKDKVYASDIKKIISWYNILVAQNIDFETKAETDTTEAEQAAE